MGADCHMHMVLDGIAWRAAIDRHRAQPNELWIKQTLSRYQSLGYHYLRDGGDRWGVGAAARRLAPDFGITYRTPLAPLCKEGCYGSFIGTTWQTMDDYARLVVSHREKGADFIKIMISGLMDFNQFGVLTQPGLPPQQIRQLIHIAHSEGMAVMAHANGADTVRIAAEAGIDSIEHGAYLDADALAAMAANHTVWVPTLSTIGNLRGTGRFSEHAVAAILDNAMEAVAAFTQMGGLIAPGTDAGAWAVPHGCDTELQLLQQAVGAPILFTEGTNKIINTFRREFYG